MSELVPEPREIRVFYDALDKHWVADLLTQPGTMSQGDSFPEALRNLADAYEAVEAVRSASSSGLFSRARRWLRHWWGHGRCYPAGLCPECFPGEIRGPRP